MVQMISLGASFPRAPIKLPQDPQSEAARIFLPIFPTFLFNLFHQGRAIGMTGIPTNRLVFLTGSSTLAGMVLFST